MIISLVVGFRAVLLSLSQLFQRCCRLINHTGVVVLLRSLLSVPDGGGLAALQDGVRRSLRRCQCRWRQGLLHGVYGGAEFLDLFSGYDAGGVYFGGLGGSGCGAVGLCVYGFGVNFVGAAFVRALTFRRQCYCWRWWRQW